MNTFLRSFFVLLMVSMALPPCRAGADTVHLKNNTELKGIVIADFKDRITYSTVGGERQILKSDIKSIEYDETIDNLISLPSW